MCMDGRGQSSKVDSVPQKLSTLSFGQDLLLGSGTQTLVLAQAPIPSTEMTTGIAPSIWPAFYMGAEEQPQVLMYT